MAGYRSPRDRFVNGIASLLQINRMNYLMDRLLLRKLVQIIVSR